MLQPKRCGSGGNPLQAECGNFGNFQKPSNKHPYFVKQSCFGICKRVQHYKCLPGNFVQKCALLETLLPPDIQTCMLQTTVACLKHNPAFSFVDFLLLNPPFHSPSFDFPFFILYVVHCHVRHRWYINVQLDCHRLFFRKTF